MFQNVKHKTARKISSNSSNSSISSNSSDSSSSSNSNNSSNSSNFILQILVLQISFKFHFASFILQISEYKSPLYYTYQMMQNDAIQKHVEIMQKKWCKMTRNKNMLKHAKRNSEMFPDDDDDESSS